MILSFHEIQNSPEYRHSIIISIIISITQIFILISKCLFIFADDKGSSSASEDFIDLDASPSHVLHEVVDGSKESEIGDTHDSMPLQRPKTTIEVDSDETDDVIHSGSGDDLETLDLEKNGDKSKRIDFNFIRA